MSEQDDTGCEEIREALGLFFQRIEATGGVFRNQKGWHAPVGEPAWVSLGEAYVKACQLVGRPVMLTDFDED